MAGRSWSISIEPLVLAGAGVKPGQYPDIQQVDIAPTAAALLGLNIPASAQGSVQTDMLVLSADQQTRINAALLAQKTQLASDYSQGDRRSDQPATGTGFRSRVDPGHG